MSEQGLIDKTALKVMADALDALVSACTGPDGKPRPPTGRDLIAARRMLPPHCKNTLSPPPRPDAGPTP